MMYDSELLGLWTLSIARYSKELEITMFRKLDPFSASCEWRETPQKEVTIPR
jgi:hypothetical protein